MTQGRQTGGTEEEDSGQIVGSSLEILQNAKLTLFSDWSGMSKYKSEKDSNHKKKTFLHHPISTVTVHTCSCAKMQYNSRRVINLSSSSDSSCTAYVTIKSLHSKHQDVG